MYVLDTNVCIHVLNDSCARLIERFAAESPATLRLCSVVKAELFYGARKSTHVARTMANLQRFFAPLPSMPFDDPAAEYYGAIRADLARAGEPIGSNDLMIAAIARAQDLTLVTHNVSEFARVGGLRVVDWEVDAPEPFAPPS